MGNTGKIPLEQFPSELGVENNINIFFVSLIVSINSNKSIQSKTTKNNDLCVNSTYRKFFIVSKKNIYEIHPAKAFKSILPKFTRSFYIRHTLCYIYFLIH